MMIRIFAFVVLLLSVLFMPFWLSVVLAFFGLMYFPIYIEAVVLLSLVDLLYGVKEPRLLGLFFVSLIISVLLLVLTEFLKKKLKFYP